MVTNKLVVMVSPPLYYFNYLVYQIPASAKAKLVRDSLNNLKNITSE